MNDKNLEITYVVIKIGEKTYSTTYSSVGKELDEIQGSLQETETEGIGKEKNIWVKGTLREQENHQKLANPMPFEINIYSKLGK